VATLAPWWIRNAVVYGAFIPTTLNVGESLYDGWNPQADGGSNMAFIDEAKKAAPHSDAPWQRREMEEDRRWRDQSLRWAADHPGRVLELAVIKAARYWSPRPNAGEFRNPTVDIGCTQYTAVAYLFAVVGLVALIRAGRWQIATLCVTPLLYFCAMHMVFVSSVRYRVPVMPFLLLLSGAGWAIWKKSGRVVKNAGC
jgi:hypothetical protein